MNSVSAVERSEPQFAGFETEAAALAYRDGRGGWVFSSNQGVCLWYDLTFTPTEIFLHFTTRAMSGRLL